MVDPIFSGIIVVPSGDVVNSIFPKTMIISVKVLPKDLFLWVVFHCHRYK